MTQVVDAVHEKGSFIYMQLIAVGRTGDPDILKEEDSSFPYVSASDIPLTGRSTAPRPLTVDGRGLFVYIHGWKF